MWRSLEEDAIMIGLDLHYFWTLNVKEYEKHVIAYNKKYKQKIQNMDYMNYILGKYIAFAFNDPKHYPNKPFTHEENQVQQSIMTDDEMEKRARRNTIKMGGVIK